MGLSKKIKICYVSSSLNIHDQRFLDKFIEKGYEVDVISFGKNKINDNRLKFHNLHLKGGIYLCRHIGIGIIRSVIFLKRLLAKIKPDILQAGWVQSDGFISALSGYHPFLLMPWGSDVLLAPQESFKKRIIAKYTLKKADMIACDAEVVKKKIIKLSNYPEDKITIFPWGIDLEKFNPEISGLELRTKLGWNDKKIIIMTRYFEQLYGIDYFFISLLEVTKKMPDTRVIMCGDGPLRDELVQFVKEHRLINYVFFAGEVPNEELPKYYNAADIYVSTSLDDGSSISLLEAMACGLPVIVTDVPANLEWVKDGDNGFIVPRKETKVLAGRIIRLLKDNGLAKKFVTKNIKLAGERANWNKNFAKLEEIYRRLIKIKS